MTIKIVTDSTCDLPPDIVESLGITVVPAFINIGDQGFLDGISLSRADFYKNLADYNHHPTTAAPASGHFQNIYDELAAAGAKAIISIHIDSNLSGMLNTARLGAEASNAQVTLVDSRQLSMGLGFIVKRAAEWGNAGIYLHDILAQIEKLKSRIFVYAALDTLEFLRRSGRVSSAQYGLGTLLSIKPVLIVHNGKLTMERIRTKKRASRFLYDKLSYHAPLAEIAILHTANPASAAHFQDEAMALLGNPAHITPIMAEVTPAIGAHTGPNAVGFACITKS